MTETPILFLIFNRPDITKRVFEEIKKQKPKKLFIAADGPRLNKEKEAELCKQTRKIVMDNIDWDCEIKTLFREENLGCRKAVSEAITWFFSNVEQGIILEDDCLPHSSFFRYCEELLEKYKNEERVMHISGNQFLDSKIGGASYYFAQIMHCWGWASWRRAWKHYDKNMETYEDFKKTNQINNIFDSKPAQDYWLNVYDSVSKNEINSWAYIWNYSIISRGGYCINPNINLVSNIGFGIDGTHCLISDHPHSNMKSYDIGDITHPQFLILNKEGSNKVLSQVLFIPKSTSALYFQKFYNALRYIFRNPFFYIFKKKRQRFKELLN